MAKLSKVQEMHLHNVTTADNAWRKAKADAHITAKLAAEAEISAHAAQRDLEVRKAFEAGVPKSRIGLGLHTSSPITVAESLARTAGMAERIAEQDANPLAKLIKWNPERENFTVTSPTGEAYPHTADGRENQTTHIGPTGEDWDVLPDSFPSDDYRDWFAGNHAELVAYMRESQR